jgi:hypothetical protein
VKDRPFRITTTAQPARPAAPKTRHVARWIMTDPANLAPDDVAKLAAIADPAPEVVRHRLGVSSCQSIPSKPRRSSRSWAYRSSSLTSPNAGFRQSLLSIG